MGQYIAHRKNYKPRRDAPPIVFNEAAAEKERQGWDTIQQVRELELKDKRARMEERHIRRLIEKEETHATALELVQERREFKEYLEQATRAMRQFFPWRMCKLNAKGLTKSGIKLNRRYIVGSLWARWIVDGPNFLRDNKTLDAASKEFVQELPIPIHRRDLRMAYRLYRKHMEMQGYETGPEWDRRDIRRILRIRRALIEFTAFLEGAHLWVSPYGGKVYDENGEALNG